MDREIFVEKVVSQSKKTSEDEILISGMSSLEGFFKPVLEDFKRNNIDSNEYSAAFTTDGAYFKYRETYLMFNRHDQSIGVKFNGSIFDTLEVIESKVVSKKYNLELSNDLLEKYLDLFFN